MNGFRFPDGDGFPPSYRDFVRHAGWGRTFGLWLIYPPVRSGYADGLLGRGGVLTERLRLAYVDGQSEEFDWMVEPDGNWDLPPSLQVFGWSENGDALLWDTSARHADGEFGVWESVGMNSLHRRGADLAEALSAVRERTASLTDASGFDVDPLEPTLL
ncbi:hypothetical protein JVX90_12595 [Gordonia sp. PDNC005]|nr:hypothetical protein JVX90_12595 [Gordonia sp. PDNC005]